MLSSHTPHRGLFARLTATQHDPLRDGFCPLKSYLMEYFLRHGGETILDALLAHLAPLGWQHINLIGELPLDFTLARQIRNIVPQKG
jgi:hypothetical protein